MRIVFLSNYFNHHQKPLSDALFCLTGGQYRFIATEAMTQERIRMGWGGEEASYVMQYDETPDRCQQWIDQAEVVLFGSAPYGLIRERLRKKKLTFVYSERIYKQECPRWQLPLRRIKYYYKYGRFSNLYLLCASAYTASDYARTGTFVGKAYSWGYFPELKTYGDIAAVIAGKQPGSILWVARYLDWKHPEMPVLLAKALREKGYKFQIEMIGAGEMEPQIREMIEEQGLQDWVHMLGAMKPEQVRAHMEKAQIFLMTSDRQEGWGAVLNEAMNSGCAVVADRAAGAVPMLVAHGKNGLVYDTQEMLLRHVQSLLDDPALSAEYGKEAYRTMTGAWNGDVAAWRLLQLIGDLERQGTSARFREGPCAKQG